MNGSVRLATCSPGAPEKGECAHAVEQHTPKPAGAHSGLTDPSRLRRGSDRAFRAIHDTHDGFENDDACEHHSGDERHEAISAEFGDTRHTAPPYRIAPAPLLRANQAGARRAPIWIVHVSVRSGQGIESTSQHPRPSLPRKGLDSGTPNLAGPTVRTCRRP